MPYELTGELKKVDELCEAWAKERRESDPTIKCTLHNMALRKADVVLDGPTEMSDLSLVIDHIYLSADPAVQAFLIMWYVDGSPVVVKCKKLGIKKTAIYARWKEILNYIRGRLHVFHAEL